MFNNTSNSVSLGDVVRVTGTAGEFQEQTQISNVTAITVCSSGATITPTDVTLPVASSTYLERFEGMLVRLPQSLYVTEHYQLGRFGQVVMSVNARQMQPTNVVAPGAAAAAPRPRTTWPASSSTMPRTTRTPIRSSSVVVAIRSARATRCVVVMWPRASWAS